MPQPVYFLDTSYIYALFNTRDQWHPNAVEWQRLIASNNIQLITTQFVMAEIADGLSAIRFRQKVASILRELENADDVTTVSASQELFQRSMELFESRDDKDWGFTDCSSFVVMKKKGIIDALTTDEHFRQAGFNALMLDPIN